MSTPQGPVTIIGAGPAGLCLARYLQLHSVPCVVYEREESAEARGQGGTLDLHEESGLLTLREIGLLDDARAMMRPEGEAMRVFDKSGKAWIDESPEKSSFFPERPEIDRGMLRDLLLGSLEPGTIQWNHGVGSTRVIDNDTYEVTFLDGTSITTNILIGADGTFSRVRPLLHSTKPTYNGISLYDMLIPESSMTPSIREFVGSGMCIVLGDGKAFIPQMNSAGKCKVYAELKCDEKWLEQNKLPETGKREWINKLYPGWTKGVEECIMAVDESTITPRRLYAFDSKFRWSSDLSGVTIMGDAAHAMAPSGEGVNQAMKDALELGQTLVAELHAPPRFASLAPFPLSFLPVTQTPCKPRIRRPDPKRLHKAIRRYERRMMERVAPEMWTSEELYKCWFGPDAAKTFKGLFKWLMIWGVWDMVVGTLWRPLRGLWA
ncbi:hypothetical protein BD324DRAFT_591423 [Kockovaella imperatae]|uniref:FAD-binding domain-containing protein n=1 Tax=Kockovaella imperatae TaxID=4999 RepID=A0A1Y1UFE4_9TREE|nr:hypothetical protein BD324DRAFT_591423 [Kockovaella imperatae]ORX36224.1 hypothetical protein BD324DRAFT_591423 [Kockovaella imperatae]